MKIKVWTVATDSRDTGLETRSFGTEAEANAAFKLEIDNTWENWSHKLDDDAVQPDDPQEAYDLLNEEIDEFCDYVLLDSQEIDVPFPDYGHDIEAALCVWEWMNQEAQYTEYNELWGNYGSGGMRMTAVQAGKIVLSVYELMEARGLEYTTAYDFGFVPAVLEQLDWPTLVDNNQYGDGSYRPDPEPILAKLMADQPDNFTDIWLDEAKREAKKQWCYEQLVTDHEDKIDRTEKPADWVRQIGEAYDLTPAADWFGYR